VKKEILFIHSAGPQGLGEGSTGLTTYLHDVLGAQYPLHRPLMPDTENPRYHSWKAKLENEFAQLGKDVILIGHSLGGTVLLKYLSEEKQDVRIAGLFLISIPHWGAKDWEIDEFTLDKNFVSKLPRISNVFLYHSKLDKWVPFDHLDYYAKKFPNAKIHALDGYEHEFLYGLPELVEDIRKLG